MPAPFHLNSETGAVNRCGAKTPETCPFGAPAHFDTPLEARAAYEASQALPPGLKKSLSKEQLAALGSYQAGGYWHINGDLRHHGRGVTDDAAEEIAALDSIFEQSELEAPEQVYRVVYAGKSNGYLDWAMQPGERFEEPGYLSTSEYYDFAIECLEDGLNDEPVNTVMVIETDPRARCLRPRAHTYKHDDEEEVLFERGLVFEVVEDDRSGEHRYLTVRMVAPEDH